MIHKMHFASYHLIILSKVSIVTSYHLTNINASDWLHFGAACSASRWAVSRSASRASRQAAPWSACPFSRRTAPPNGVGPASRRAVGRVVSFRVGSVQVASFPDFVTKVQEVMVDQRVRWFQNTRNCIEHHPKHLKTLPKRTKF